MSPRPQDDEEERRRQAAQQGSVMPPPQAAPQAAPPSNAAGMSPVPTQGQPKSRGAPTNFVNFVRRLNANHGVAQREADKYAGQAQAAAGRSSMATQNASDAFAKGVNTGTVQAPGGGPSTNVGGGAPAAVPPPAPVQPAPLPPEAPGTKRDELVGESTRPGGTGKTLAEMLALAGSKYTGPSGLGDKASGLDDTDAAAQALAAQQQLDLLKDDDGLQTMVNEQPTSGTDGSDALSAALIGSTGRQNFDSLRARFNPNKELQDARDKAAAQAKQATTDSEKNAAEWGRMAGVKGADEEQQAAYDKAKADAAAERETERKRVAPDNIVGDEKEALWGVDPGDTKAVAAAKEQWKQFQMAQEYDAGDTVRKLMHYSSPMAQLGVSKTEMPVFGAPETMGNNLNKSVHGGDPKKMANGGGEWGGEHIPWRADDFIVYKSLTPDEWAQLRNLPQMKMREFIDTKKVALAPKRKNVSYGSSDINRD